MSTLTKCKQQRKNEKIIAYAAWSVMALATIYFAGHILAAWGR